jgi:hypothetical protein
MFWMVGSFCAQIFAIQWALKSKWSDFKLVAESIVAADDPNPSEELPTK